MHCRWYLDHYRYGFCMHLDLLFNTPVYRVHYFTHDILSCAVPDSFKGKISPWTGRFYSLLDPSYAKNHIPIIASVSEHQPTSWSSFYFDLQILVFLFPLGLYFCFSKLTDSNIFLILYGVTSLYFAVSNFIHTFMYCVVHTCRNSYICRVPLDVDACKKYPTRYFFVNLTPTRHWFFSI